MKIEAVLGDFLSPKSVQTPQEVGQRLRAIYPQSLTEPVAPLSRRRVVGQAEQEGLDFGVGVEERE